MFLQIRENFSKESDFYEKEFQSATGRFDVYVLFMEKSYQLIKNNGVVCNLNGTIDENTLLKKLIELDEKIIEFSKVKTSLEDIFIRLNNV